MHAAPIESHWLNQRSCGVLLHPSSLPSECGIGNLGASARRFIDFLSAAGFHYWQVCPFGPTGYGDSPYQCFSAFAGNPYFIDWQVLLDNEILHPSDLDELRRLPHDRVDYGWLYQAFYPVARKAYERYRASGFPTFNGYVSFADFKENRPWLRPYAVFRALKDRFNGLPWQKWPPRYRNYVEFLKLPPDSDLEAAAEAHFFYQYLFFNQWRQLRAYAAGKNIRIIGDIPIFVAIDSADVWSCPAIFDLRRDGNPRAVAGVPPDYFSPTGQLWGNPLFRWDVLKDEGYQWWLDRLKANFELYDVIRLDHFRGFHNYWAIPYGRQDAVKGKWLPGPGMDFFDAVMKAFPNAPLMAEDLGELIPEVYELRDACGFPGMAILQFAFGSGSANKFLPHNHQAHSVVYTGTHDNDTSLGWYQKASPETQDHFRRYLRVPGDAPQWDLIRAAYESVANLAIIPLQDLLDLGSEARMNHPGEPSGNWQWRCFAKQLDKLEETNADYLYSLADLYGRLVSPSSESSRS